MPNDTVFHAGDKIRFNVEANTAGYLYIINQGSSGTWKPMFPSPDIEDGNNHIEGWRPYTMPPKSRLAFDSTVGTENLFIVFSLKPEDDLESMIYSLQGKKAPAAAATPEPPVHSSKELIMAANISNSAVDRLRNAYSRDLIIEKVDPNTAGDKKETAVYVVNADRKRGFPRGCRSAPGASMIRAAAVAAYQPGGGARGGAERRPFADDGSRLLPHGVDPGKAGSDTWRAIDPGLVLAQNDRVRFKFRTNFDGYLYVMNQSTSGKYEQLFPREETGRDNRISASKEYQVPATSAAFRIAGPPGHEIVYWMVTPARLTDVSPAIRHPP